MQNSKELKVLITEKQIDARIKSIANQINSTYPKDEPLYVICVLKGAVIFFSQLFKQLTMPVYMDFVQFSSYGQNQQSSGNLSIISRNLPPLEGKNVLIIEDILDTGLTLSNFKSYLKETSKAKDIKIATLLNKQSRRLHNINADFTCFEIEDKFVVGFGLDVDQACRNIPYIGYFE